MEQKAWRFPAVAERVGVGVIFAVAIIDIGMLIAGLYQQPAAFYDFDEGVYWLTLRSMGAGHHLYQQIFYSQAPFFLPALYPFYVSLGSTLQGTHLGLAVLSLLGLAGAYMLGRALGGQAGGIASLAIIGVTPMYLTQSQKLCAEGPAVAFVLLAVGAALMWRRHPGGWSGYCFALLSAIALSLGVLTKFFVVVAVVPVLLIIAAHLWECAFQETDSDIQAGLLPLVVAIAAGAITTRRLAPFAHCFDQAVRRR